MSESKEACAHCHRTADPAEVFVQLTPDFHLEEAHETAEEAARECLRGYHVTRYVLPETDSAIASAARLEGERAGRLAVLDELGGIESIRNLQVELKGAQLMVFQADTPEKRSLAFKCIGGVVSWLMQAESELRSKLSDTGNSDV